MNYTEARNNWFVSKIREIEASGVSQAEVAKRLGVKPQYLTPILGGRRNASEKFVSKFCEVFGISHNDLYRDVSHLPDPMAKTQSPLEVAENLGRKLDHLEAEVVDIIERRKPHNKENQELIATASQSDEGIPLIPLDAMAGFCTGNSEQVFDYECERYVVPVFQGAEFMMQVKGSSMYPKYSSGDIVACKCLPLDTFFQWNKVYVVDTEQGVLIKRVKRGSDDEHITLMSENERYEPFEIYKSEITSLAIVIGVIRLE